MHKTDVRTYNQSMSITVGELVRMSRLGLSVHSGSGGLDRSVTWTHTTDLPEPWSWISGGELVMTNGMSFPKTATAQRDTVHRLVDNGAVALAIGEEMYCPPLTKSLASISDELAFPVLWISYPMPFVAISRTVAEATLIEQNQRLLKTERIYSALQRISSDKAGLRRLTDGLGRVLKCRVLLCDRKTGESWSGDDSVDEEIRAAVAQQRGLLRAGVRAVSLPESRYVFTLGLPTHPDAVLVCEPHRQQEPDPILMQHAATVCALGISQARLVIEQQSRSGAEMFTQLVDGYLSPNAVTRHLAEYDLRPAEAVIVAVRSEADGGQGSGLDIRLWRANIAHLTAHHAGVVASVVAQRDLGRFGVAVGESAVMGISESVGHPARFAEADREARWALDIATSRGVSPLRYPDAVPPIGPRTPDEAESFVRLTLSAILDRPEPESADLLETLMCFLDAGRSWQRTADLLHVHRQTVLYRIKKIEQLLGLDTSSTADIATLWVAIDTYRRVRDA